MSSAIQGLLIPPSHNMVIYCMAAAGGVSVGQMFMGHYSRCISWNRAYGIFLFCGIEKNYPKGEKFSLKIAVKAFVDGIWGILTILIVVVGVVAGFLQRQSLQRIACVYSIIVVLFILQICFYKRRRVLKRWQWWL